MITAVPPKKEGKRKRKKEKEEMSNLAASHPSM